MAQKLYKISDGKVFCGVCAGLGQYFDIDPVVIRLAWLLFAFLGGAGLLAYIIAAIIVPKEPSYIDGGKVNY